MRTAAHSNRAGKTLLLGALLALSAIRSSLAQGVSATADITAHPAAGGTYDYSITLHNTGEQPLTEFWFAWYTYSYPPYYTYNYDLLPSQPGNVQAPAGWSPYVIGTGGASDGYSIDFTTSTPLAAGSSLGGFMFTSTDSPSTLAAPSPYYYGYYSADYSYAAGLEGAYGELQPSVTTVPEPATLVLLAAGGLLLGCVRTKHRTSNIER
jgi:PEP-CTERM motif